ncbi:putative glutamate carboxypeptidase LAMP1 [Capsicum annuum]|uniref:probable glutamate carboxypeptidase LAMP1 n=1 Tax=Capsicum annuum TaxID=4072 RepID=UPI001FB0E472|nr:probable glutamate carboxypeptidase LAMP1 [Capsicum annuum]XP_047270953.1 probable glutamate carboxypeptidase LAMP1 [Capsicum annuum]XP_047270954.1 probable glutamate carboxypeptidase LAMP1 [Capsicum annuum]XP_047270955.1 probable glutamate carboxypeptidase LAMP1 [Capsicum annuum]
MLTTHSLQIGSAKWVEENWEILAARIVAYLNVDCAVQGGPFRASATPQLDDIIIEAAQQAFFIPALLAVQYKRILPSDAASGPISPMDATKFRDDNDPNDIL